MAEDNMVQPKQPQNPVDQIATDAGLPAEPVNVPGPSTAENQQDTESAKKITEKQNFLQRQTGKKPSRAEAQFAMLQDIEKDEAKAKKAQDEADAEAQLEAEAEQARVTKALQMYEQTKQKFAERGMDFEVDENFETLIAQREQENEKEQQLAVQAQQEELQKQQQMEQMQKLQAVEAEKQAIRKQEAVQQAEAERQQEKIKKQEKENELAQNEVAKDNETVKRIDGARFFKNLSTGEKIIAAISVALSGMGSGLTGQANAALAMIDKQIAADIKDQELSYEESKAKEQEAYNRLIQRLEIQERQLKNQKIAGEIGQLKAQLSNKREVAIKQQLTAKRRKMGFGLSESDIDILAQEDPKIRDRIVYMPNGEIQLAGNKKQGEDLTKFVNEVQPGLDTIMKLGEYMDDPDFSRFSPEQRAEVETLRKTLVGQLRLPLVGPGALTEMEMKLIQDTVGDPNKFFALPGVEKAKLRALAMDLKSRINRRYSQAGIKPPVMVGDKMYQGVAAADINAALVKQLQSRQPGLSKKAAEKELKRNNKWAK